MWRDLGSGKRQKLLLVITTFFLAVLLITACHPQAPANVATAAVAQGLPSSSPTTVVIKRTPTQPAVSITEVPTVNPTNVQSLPTQAPSNITSSICSAPATLTPALTEGPYFKANSPERASLIDSGTPGTRLVLTGYVLTMDCQPVAHALLDFWQADANGQYDNAGYNFRGHQFADENGFYQLTTVVPGLYPGRTEHIHVKVQAPNGPVLTSQLFFPGVQDNESDQIFDRALVISITKESSATVEATFNFIVSP